jgi:hypothetical protein
MIENVYLEYLVEYYSWKEPTKLSHPIAQGQAFFPTTSMNNQDPASVLMFPGAWSKYYNALWPSLSTAKFFHILPCIYFCMTFYNIIPYSLTHF